MYNIYQLLITYNFRNFINFDNFLLYDINILLKLLFKNSNLNTIINLYTVRHIAFYDIYYEFHEIMNSMNFILLISRVYIK